MKGFWHERAVPAIVTAKYLTMGMALTMLLLIMFVVAACGSGK